MTQTAAPTTSSAEPAIEPAETFLDPERLVAASRPRAPRWAGMPLLIAGLFLVVFIIWPADSTIGAALRGITPLILIGLWLTLTVVGRSGARRLAAETEAVTALDELVQLRRWPEAADLANRLLGTSMLSAERRLHALVGLSTILMRYHRFDDARQVQEYLLGRGALSEAGPRGEGEPLVDDASAAHSIRVARAMGMLRADHLVDADRAMAELRREVNQARDEVRRAVGPEAATRVRSAGLVLLDLFRDVKTHHYAEAVANFDASIGTLREQLGGRVADAWMLYAAALHGLRRTDEAREAYANATALAPAVELHRRYPETATLAQVYAAWSMPG